MKLRRFSQLGWHGCMDLVAAAAGHHVVRVELGEPPKKMEGVVGAELWTVDGVNFHGTHGGARFLKVPNASLRVVPEWAEAMGLDPAKMETAPATEPCEICKELFPPRELDCEPYGRICDPCYWSLHNS